MLVICRLNSIRLFFIYCIYHVNNFCFSLYKILPLKEATHDVTIFEWSVKIMFNLYMGYMSISYLVSILSISVLKILLINYALCVAAEIKPLTIGAFLIGV